MLAIKNLNIVEFHVMQDSIGIGNRLYDNRAGKNVVGLLDADDGR